MYRQSAVDTAHTDGAAPIAVRPALASRLLRRLRDAATLLITPGLCRACSLPLLQADAYPVCADCLAGLRSPNFSLCWTCGDVLGVDEERGAGFVPPERLRCAACTVDEPRFARTVAFGSYRGTLRNLIHLYKFEGVQTLAVPLARHLARSMTVLLRGAEGPFTVVAVPLFRGRRGFNQSELLADEAIKLLRLRHPEITLHCEHRLLQRTRPTESQSQLTPRQRRENVRNAFHASADARGRHILLVDDVLTTGATADACAAELLRAGAASVNIATLARAHRRDTMPAGGDIPPAGSYGGNGEPWTTWTSVMGEPAKIHSTDEGEKR